MSALDAPRTFLRAGVARGMSSAWSPFHKRTPTRIRPLMLKLENPCISTWQSRGAARGAHTRRRIGHWCGCRMVRPGCWLDTHINTPGNC
eukprot:6614240-Prymnesium_polylepis.1